VFSLSIGHLSKICGFIGTESNRFHHSLPEVVMKERQMHRLIKSTLLALVGLLIGSSQVQSAIIVQTMDGFGPSWNATNGGASTPLNFQSFAYGITAVNTVSPSPSLTAGFSTVLTIGNTPTVSGSQLIYNVTSGAFAFTITDGTKTDTFTVTPTWLATSTGPPGNGNAATVMGTLVLTSGNNIPAYDFSTYSTGVNPNILFSLNTSTTGGFPALFASNGATANGTGSFSSNASGLDPIPEPASFVILSSMLIGCGAVWVSKRQRCKSA
jgi:hypothetical protein